MTDLHNITYMQNVIPQASKVPRGIDVLGFLRSPEILAPAEKKKRYTYTVGVL